MRETTAEVTTDNRRFSRVIFSRTAKLLLGEKKSDEGEVHDLSIGGLFLEGEYPIRLNELFELELHESGRHSCLILTFQVQVVRIEPHGIALQFMDMPPDSYKFLQTMVLYSTDDPYGVSLEFLEDFPAVQAAC
jgi:hypothetical protein